MIYCQILKENYFIKILIFLISFIYEIIFSSKLPNRLQHLIKQEYKMASYRSEVIINVYVLFTCIIKPNSLQLNLIYGIFNEETHRY